MRYALVRGTDGVLHGPGPWQPRIVADVAQRAGVSVTFGAAAPAGTIVLVAGPPALRVVVTDDPPDHDATLSAVTWSPVTGDWTVRHRSVAAMQAALVERSRQICRAGILARASIEDQINAALADGEQVATMSALVQGWRTAHAAHQAAIEALDDQDDLAGYDLATGWPG